jgi:hypothetical protein
MSKQVLKQVSPHTSVWVDEEDETMNNKKQSSIDWLVEQMIKYELVPKGTHFDNVLFHQAKAMHQQEIEGAYDREVIGDIQNWYIRNGKHYYELHYNKTSTKQDNE